MATSTPAPASTSTSATTPASVSAPTSAPTAASVPAAASAADANSIAITNNAAVPVITLDSYDPSTTPSGAQVYGLPLTVRGTTIAAGATENVPLDPTRMIYDLISARPADLFPIQNTGVEQDIMSGNYDPMTVAATSAANMVLAMQFALDLMVYPSAPMAVQYTAMLNNAMSATSSDGIDSAASTFFSQFPTYQTLTIDMVVTAQSYISAFAYVWAGFSTSTSPISFSSFNSSCTYYLYSAGTAAAGSSTAAPVAQGTVTFTKNPSAPTPADPTDPCGGYTIQFVPTSGAAVNLTYLGGQFVSDDSGFPAIALQGSFVLKSAFTNSTSDGFPIPLLTGQAYNIQVMGTTFQQTGSSSQQNGSSSNDGSFTAFFDPSTFQGWVEMVSTVLGLLMGAQWVASGIGWFCKKIKGSPSEFETMQAQFSETLNNALAKQTAILEKLKLPSTEVPQPSQLAQTQTNIQTQTENVANSTGAQIEQQIVNTEATQIQQVVEESGANATLENDMVTLRNTEQTLQTVQQETAPTGNTTQNPTTEANIEATLNTTSTNLTTVEDNVTQTIKTTENTTSANTNNTTNTENTITEELNQEVTNQETVNQEKTGNNDNEFEDGDADV